MKKISFLLLLIFGHCLQTPAEPVSMNEAKKVAIAFYLGHESQNKGLSGNCDGYVTRYNGMTVFYTFNFNPGFVIVAADDRVTPVIAYSYDSRMPSEISNPAVKEWLDRYGKEISRIVSLNLSNRSTLKEWTAAGNGQFKTSAVKAVPLLTTLWDQGCGYNQFCPFDPMDDFNCMHTPTGCVATAMAQIMKYHHYPPVGYGSHSYQSSRYGIQAVGFDTTHFAWDSMPNTCIGSMKAVAGLMYAAGVSVDMDYSYSSSGANSDKIPNAFRNYFLYDPDLTTKFKDDYTNLIDWINLLIEDIDDSLPILYCGQGYGRHAFVCDGYNMNDTTFHFNWGWSGQSNGWFRMGTLNPQGGDFSEDNLAVLHIRPYEHNLLVRFDYPGDNEVYLVRDTVEIKATTRKGTAARMDLMIDGKTKSTVNGNSLSYTWLTAVNDLGSHEIKVTSYSSSDTACYIINLNVSEWASQASGFTTPQTMAYYLSAVDSNVVWATGCYSGNQNIPCPEFTRTTDGGKTWVPGKIQNSDGLNSSMIFGISAQKAYAVMFQISGINPAGIFMTSDGGNTWIRQAEGTAFVNYPSFPNCIHFFNEYDGWCFGDPVNGAFEMYTTTNGGTTWTQVDTAHIPTPLPGECGTTGFYCAVHDTLWFGSSRGRIFHSTDRGLTWSASPVPGFSGYTKPAFYSGTHGLVLNMDVFSSNSLVCETFDGGITWTPVTRKGNIYPTEIEYIPGTPSTFATSGRFGFNGASCSFNGGHSWQDFFGTKNSVYSAMAWVNDHCGWAGGMNTDSVTNGIFKFVGVLKPTLNPPTNLSLGLSGKKIRLKWNPPDYDTLVMNLMGYRLNRNGMQVGADTIINDYFDDNSFTPGGNAYCVSAIYNLGHSSSECTDISGPAGLRIYPNPASNELIVDNPDAVLKIRIINMQGKEVYTTPGTGNLYLLDVSGLSSGLYLVEVFTASNSFTSRLIIR